MNCLDTANRENFLTELNILTKFFITLFFLIYSIVLGNSHALLIIFVVSFLYLLPVKKYKTIFFIYLFISFMFLLSIFFSWTLSLIVKKYGVQEDFKMVAPFLRVAIMTNLTLAFILSVKIERVVVGLRLIRLPRFLFLPLIIVFRFVPSFFNDIKMIHAAIKIKIGEFTFFTILNSPQIAIRMMILPAVIRALRSAEELTMAAELKGISSNAKSTSIAPADSWSLKDFAVLLVASMVTLITAIINFGIHL